MEEEGNGIVKLASVENRGGIVEAMRDTHAFLTVELTTWFH
jgi:hypothetical protein